jgi:hypothetical protein
MTVIDHADLVGCYRHYRAISTDIHHRLLETLPKADMQAGARRLGMLQGDTLVFGSEEEMSVLMDYCLYDVSRDGRTPVRQFAAARPFPEGSDEAAVVAAMTRARYSLVAIDRIVEGVGAWANDVFYEQDVLIADQGLSQTRIPGFVLATRLLPFEDFAMTGGAALPILDEQMCERVIVAMAEHIEDGQSGFADLSARQRSAATADIIRICLEEDSSESIRYGEPEEGGGAEPFVREQRIKPNQPCPCGSGRKYKKCCGRGG